MKSSLIVPSEWINSESTADVQSHFGDCAQRSTFSHPNAASDYCAKFAVFNHENGVIVSALPTFERMAKKAKLWLPKLLEIMKRCDIDPALYPRILHISADDWRKLQQGKLEAVSIKTALSGWLLWEILSFIYSFVGSWDAVSQWLVQVESLRVFDNRCPLHIIKSGDVREMARLHHFLAGEVLGSPYS